MSMIEPISLYQKEHYGFAGSARLKPAVWTSLIALLSVLEQAEV